ncbi:MAG: aspartate aminotransferase family protein [Ignavibacteriae bacterium]|nr:aspartate aminotransferase family protein [Ignavibacteriota bacterium]
MKNYKKTEGDINNSVYRDKWMRNNIDEKTRKIINEDSKYFLHQSLSTPCMNTITHCEGNYIFDEQGRSYLDFHGNNVHQVGYSNQFVIDAVKEQLDTLTFSPRRYTNQKSIDLAKKLINLTNKKLNKVLFAPGGTTVVGIAIKLARRITGKYKTISWWDSFHGASLDSISVGGEGLFRNNIGPLSPGAIHVPPPNSYSSPLGNKKKSFLESINYIEYIFERETDIAAFIAEPIRYTTVSIPEKKYWKRVRELCDKHETLLIFDEIPTAFGRSGKMFVYENFNVIPDILCLGKGLGGGIIPIAALLTKDIYDTNGDISLGHYTHEKNPIGAAAGLAMIDYIEKNNLLQNSIYLGRYFLKKLNQLKKKVSIIGDVRGIGLLLAIELVKDRKTKEPATEIAEYILYQSLSMGLNFKVSAGNIISLMPPLTITKNEIEKSIEILDECFTKAKKEFKY